MVNGIGKFNNEERILLNNICKDESLTKLTKEDVKTSLMISREIVNDDLMVELIDDLLDTLENMPEQEWKQTKMLLPFPVVEADSVVVQPDNILTVRTENGFQKPFCYDKPLIDKDTC